MRAWHRKQLGWKQRQIAVALGVREVTVKRFVSRRSGFLGDRSHPKPELSVQKLRRRGMAPPPPCPAPLWETIPPEAQAAVLALVASLGQRIADLEAENADLRRRLAQVEHQLQSIRRRGKRPSHRRDRPQDPRADRRRKDHRQHPGCFRLQPIPR